MPSREEKQWEHHRNGKQMRRIRKEIQRNREPKRVRQKQWLPGSLDAIDEQEELIIPQEERIMPRGERERRKKVLTAAIAKLQKEETGEVASLQTDTGGKEHRGGEEHCTAVASRPKESEQVGTVI